MSSCWRARPRSLVGSKAAAAGSRQRGGRRISGRPMFGGGGSSQPRSNLIFWRRPWMSVIRRSQTSSSGNASCLVRAEDKLIGGCGCGGGCIGNFTNLMMLSRAAGAGATSITTRRYSNAPSRRMKSPSTTTTTAALCVSLPASAAARLAGCSSLFGGFRAEASRGAQRRLVHA